MNSSIETSMNSLERLIRKRDLDGIKILQILSSLYDEGYKKGREHGGWLQEEDKGEKREEDIQYIKESL